MSAPRRLRHGEKTHDVHAGLLPEPETTGESVILLTKGMVYNLTPLS
jgi:hypothetical protein